MTAELWAASTIGVAASVEDLWHRRISNWIPLAALLAGLALGAGRGWRGCLLSLAGTLTGFAVFSLFYLLGGLGGGDVKLMAGFGALLGPARTGEAALMVAILGAGLALGWLLVSRWRGREAVAIPYAPAISLGCWMVLVARPGVV